MRRARPPPAVAGHRDARRARGLPPCIAPVASAPKPRGARARLRSVCRRHRPTFEFYPGWKRVSTRWKHCPEVHKGFYTEKVPNHLCHKQPLRLLLVGQGIDSPSNNI